MNPHDSHQNPAAADSSEEEVVYVAEVAHEVLASGVTEVPEAARTDGHRKEKFSAIFMTLAVHAILLLLLAVAVVIVPQPGPSEITAMLAPTSAQETVEKQKVAEQPPQQIAQSAASVSFLSAVSTSNIAMPSIEFDATSEAVNLGTTMGSFDVGTGSRGFGTISFMGNSGQGRRVVFAVDASRSMNSSGKGKAKAKGGNTISKFDLMKQELDKSLSKLPQGSEYQVLFFSAFAWPHNEVDTNIQAQWEGYRWLLRQGEENPTIPKTTYLKGTSEQIKKSRELVQNTQMTLGTQWGPPVLMALNIRPKPDIIFFMTDGTTGNPQGWIDMINAANKKGGKKAVIHTTAMMEPAAARDLASLAESNGGKFTIIQSDGKVLTGEEFFKQQGNP
jgi:hypothetical protein